MTILDLTVEKVENIISSSPRKNGSYNLFFKINNHIGLKLSLTKKQRDSNYKHQENASKIGLGPNVYGKIDNVNYENCEYYGYFTEIVDVILMKEKSYDFIRLLYKTFSEDIKELVENLKKCGFIFEDNHLGNIGVKNGKIICIDFDEPDNCYRCLKYMDRN